MGSGQLDLDHYPYNVLHQIDDLERRVSELERFPAGTAGGGSGTMLAHDLDGVWHSGQIADDQAPQFIMHDGSRSFTGDQSLGEHNLTNVGDISLDSISADAGTITMLLDNAQAAALTIWDGTDTFLVFDTTVGVERVEVGQAMTLAGTLYFGTGEDTNLYRNAANVLRTDDSFRADKIGIGADPTYPLDIAYTHAHTSGYQYGVELDIYSTGGGSASIIAFGAWAYGNTATTGTIRGFQMEAEINASVANAEAGVFYVDLNAGTIGTVKIIRVVAADTASVSVTDFYHATIEANLLAAATVTNEYGLWIGDVTRGSTLAYSIYTGVGLLSWGDDMEFRQAAQITTTTGDLTLAPAGDLLVSAALKTDELWLQSSGTPMLVLDDTTWPSNYVELKQLSQYQFRFTAYGSGAIFDFYNPVDNESSYVRATSYNGEYIQIVNFDNGTSVFGYLYTSNAGLYFGAGTLWDYQMRLSGNGHLSLAGAGVSTIMFITYSHAADHVGHVIRGYSSQTANLMEFQNSAATVMAGFDERGCLFSDLGTDSTNFIIGAGAGNITMTGNNNTIIGYQAGISLTTGNRNVIIGHQAGNAYLDDDIENVMIGYQAGYNSRSSASVYIGYSAGKGQTGDVATGGNNVVVGHGSGTNFTTANATVHIGRWAGYAVTTGYSNVYVGMSAGYENTAGYANVVIGASAGKGVASTSDYLHTVFVGYEAGLGITAGDYNVCVGSRAGKSLTTQSSNVHIGAEAGEGATGGTCIYIGRQAGRNNAGNYGVAIGQATNQYTSGDHNICIGYAAGTGVTGTSTFDMSVLIGGYAGQNLTTGARSVVVGYQAGANLNTGSYNVLIGWQAGNNLTSGQGNIIIGYNLNASAADANNELNIGDAITGGLSTKEIGVNTAVGSIGAQLHVTIGAADRIGMIVKAAASQTAHLQEWQDSGSTARAYVNATGRIVAEPVAAGNSEVAIRGTIKGGGYTWLAGVYGQLDLYTATSTTEGDAPSAVKGYAQIRNNSDPPWVNVFLADGRTVDTGTSIGVLKLYAAKTPTVDSGTSITTLYGLHLPNIDVATTNNYAIYTNAGGVSFGDDLEFRQAAEIATTTGDLTLAPAGDLLLDPTGDQVIFANWGAGKSLESDDYVSQTTGWAISSGTGGGDADFRYIYADELHVQAFVAEVYQALVGAIIVTKSRARISRNFTIPSNTNSATLYVEDLEGWADTQLFAANDVVLLRHIDTSGGGLVVTDVWGVVTVYTDLTGGEQSYTFTTSDDGGVSGSVIFAGAIALDYGQSGSGSRGVWEATVLDSAGAPYSQVATWATNPWTPANWTTRVRLGNLDGISGIGLEYGLWAGQGTAAGDAQIILSDSSFEVHSIQVSLYQSGTETVRLDPAVPSIALGATLPTAYATGTGIWMGNDSSTYKFRVGDPAGVRLSWDGSQLDIGDQGNEHITVDATKLSFNNGAAEMASLSGTEWVIGETSGAPNVRITSSALQLREATTVYLELTSSGLILGDDGASNPEYMTISSTGLAMYANGTLVLDISNTPVVKIGDQTYEHIVLDGSALTFKDGSTTLATLTGEVWTLGITTDDHLEIGATNGIRFLDGSSNVHGQLDAGSWTLGRTNYPHITMDTTEGLQFIDGGTVSRLQIQSSDIRVGTPGAENILVTSTAINFRDGSTVYGSLSSAAWTIGLTTDDHIEISAANGIRFIDGSSNVQGQLNAGTWTLGPSAGEHVSITATSIILYGSNGTTERLSLSSDVVTIKNSAGNAVFTFDASAGAEMTLPLTLGTSGGIYQGTGTFSSPTTGLKMWNDSGVGRIAGYSGGTIQWYATSSGQLRCGPATGGDYIVMDANGLTISGTSYLRFYDPVGAGLVGYMHGERTGPQIEASNSYAAHITLYCSGGSGAPAGGVQILGKGLHVSDSNYDLNELVPAGELVVDGDAEFGGDIDISGSILSSTPIAVGVRNSSQQALTTSVWTALTYNVEIHDTDTMWSSGNANKLYATRAGYYMISASLVIQALNDGDRLILNITANGVTIASNETRMQINAGTPYVAVAGGPFYLAAGQYVQIFAYHDYGSGRNTVAATAANPNYNCAFMAKIA